MRRRHFLQTAIAGTLAGSRGVGRAAADVSQKYLVLEWFRSRQDLDMQRLRDFLGANLLPAYERAGAKPIGFFSTSVGPDQPSLLMMAQYTSMGAIQEASTKLAGDEKWNADQKAFDEKWELGYERRESSLLCAFRSFPSIEIPKVEAGKSNLFELRMYESRNVGGHVSKVAMFDNGEIDLFRRCGIVPVFFGSTIIGPRLPNLTYMICFPSMEARIEAWGKFGQHPDWKKMSSAPGNTNRELVSSISNQLMTPLPFSQIK